MLFTRDQGHLEKTRITLSPSADEWLDLKNTGKLPRVGEYDGFRVMTLFIFLALFPDSF